MAEITPLGRGETIVKLITKATLFVAEINICWSEIWFCEIMNVQLTFWIQIFNLISSSCSRPNQKRAPTKDQGVPLLAVTRLIKWILSDTFQLSVIYSFIPDNFLETPININNLKDDYFDKRFSWKECCIIGFLSTNKIFEWIFSEL